MSEFVAAPSPSHWQDPHLEHPSSAFSPENDGPQDSFSRFANGGASDVEYRGGFAPNPDTQEYQTETYPPPDFGDAEYQQPDYKWATPAASGHQEPLSPQPSAPHTPVNQTGSPQKQQLVAEKDDDLDLEEIPEETDSRQAAVDRRAEKRKMKRFRLSHTQTRFLLSEFSKQAHPDAAHRERLARSIPGLSPRQVQVWFQNRRAKLKRMPSEDRERVISTRALPENFPVLQTMHNNYSVRMLGTPVASPTDYSPQAGISPSQGPNGVPNWGLAFTPSTSSTSDMMSPQSYAGDRGYMSSGGLRPSSRAGNPYAQSPATNDAYRNRMQVPRLDTHAMARTTMAEPLSAPLKSSNYTGSSLDYGDYSLSSGGHPINALGFVEPPRSVPNSGDHANAFTYNAYAHAYPSPMSASSQHRTTGYPTPHSVSGFQSSPLGGNEYGHDSTFAPSPLSRSTTAPGNDGRAADDSRLAGLGVTFNHGHKRGRSSSHPPSFAPS